MPIAFGEAGNIFNTGAGGTTLTVYFPAGMNALTSEAVLIVAQKPATANGGTITGPGGWTQQVAALARGGYGAVLATQEGNTNLWIYTKDAPSGADSGTALAVTLGDTDVAWGVIIRLDKSEPGSVAWVGRASGEEDAGAISHVFAATDLAAGDCLLHAMAVATAISTPAAFSAWTMTQTGSTIVGDEIAEADNAAGNSIGGGLSQWLVTAGSGAGTVTAAAQYAGLSTNAKGAAGLLRARLTPTFSVPRSRWGLDDGSEAAHTWAAPEDSVVMAAPAARRLLRAQINLSGANDDTTGKVVRYKRTDEPDSEWRTL